MKVSVLPAKDKTTGTPQTFNPMEMKFQGERGRHENTFN